MAYTFGSSERILIRDLEAKSDSTEFGIVSRNYDIGLYEWFFRCSGVSGRKHEEIKSESLVYYRKGAAVEIVLKDGSVIKSIEKKDVYCVEDLEE